nr:hypothetical protein [Tanacetum cinerariifolium]
VNTPRCDEDRLEIIELMVFLLPKIEWFGIGVNATGLKVSAVRHKLLLFSLTNWCYSPSAVSYIKYALTVNPNIYVSCIKQFWNTVVVKKTDDVTRLQALVDRKKVVITEAAIRDVLRLNDAEGVDCLPNEEIFAELDRMGTDNAVQGDDAQEPSIPSPTPPTPQPQQSQDLPSTSQVQHTPPQSPQLQPQPQPQAQPHAVDFLMSLLQEALDACAALTRRVEHLECDKVALALEITKLKRKVKKLEKGNRVKVLKLRRLKKIGTSQRIDTSEDIVMEDASNQGRMIDDMDDKEEEKKEEEVKNDQV